MTNELGFYLNNETATLAEAEKLMDELSCEDRYDIGGDDGMIQYTIAGEVILHEIDDEDMPHILKTIVLKAGCWPSFVETGSRLFTQDELKEQYNNLGGNFKALWDWMKDKRDEKGVKV